MPEMMNDISEPETAVPNLMKVGEIPVNMDVCPILRYQHQ